MPVVHTARHASLEYAIALEATSTDQDRALVVPVPDGLVLALADGAGGTAHGARAADAVIAAVRANPTADPAGLLVDLDDPDRLGMAQCTAVIAHVDRCSERPTIRGASVGDSEAWLLDLLDPTILVPLTSAQHRKPLLGAGCTPVAYSHALSPTSLVVTAPMVCSATRFPASSPAPHEPPRSTPPRARSSISFACPPADSRMMSA